eukprot:12227241-Alexandrium_andersonii.AAC.1
MSASLVGSEMCIRDSLRLERLDSSELQRGSISIRFGFVLDRPELESAGILRHPMLTHSRSGLRGGS